MVNRILEMPLTQCGKLKRSTLLSLDVNFSGVAPSVLNGQAQSTRPEILHQQSSVTSIAPPPPPHNTEPYNSSNGPIKSMLTVPWQRLSRLSIIIYPMLFHSLLSFAFSLPASTSSDQQYGFICWSNGSRSPART